MKKNYLFLVILILVIFFVFQINQLSEIRQENPDATFVKQFQKLGIGSKTGILQKGGNFLNETIKWE